MMWDEQVFFESLEQDFKFLRNLGYKKRKKIEGGLFTCIYTGKVLAVEVSLDRLEQHIDLHLVRLVNNAIPNRFNLVDGKVEANLTDWLNIYGLLRRESPEAMKEIEHGGSRLSPEQIRMIVAKYAAILQTSYLDIVEGDLPAFLDKTTSQ